MTEPEYTYIKGQGWVPLTIETLVRVTDRYRVTIERRPPLDGESYYKEPKGRALEISMRNMMDYDNPDAGNKWRGDQPDDPYNQYIVVKVDRL